MTGEGGAQDCYSASLCVWGGGAVQAGDACWWDERWALQRRGGGRGRQVLVRATESGWEGMETHEGAATGAGG